MRKNFIWLNTPASTAYDAFPVGNGRSGAMVYGTVQRECIALNEDSLWYGRDYDRKNPHARDGINAVRELLKQDKPDEAIALARKVLYGAPKYINPYVPLGNLVIYSDTPVFEYTNYKRYLDLENGIAGVTYTVGGVTYKREIFASYPDGVIAVRIEADKPKAVNFSAYLMRRGYDSGSTALSESSVIMHGNCGEGGIKFACILKAIADDGKVKVYNDTISVENATAATLLIRCSTSFRTENYTADAENVIKKLGGMSYSELKKRHTDEHSSMFNRVDICLDDGGEDLSHLPMNERLKRVRAGETDTGIIELLYKYGRYLLMASARSGSLPANLQGIWNVDFAPNWDSAYTININTQMNYWHAENSNLSECHLSLADFMQRLAEKGRITAREVYGCRGFVAHHNSSIYADSDIEGSFDDCVIWPMGGAWLSLHLWEHYDYTLDRDFLADKAYPVMKDAALFFLDYMTEDENGQLVTGPSLSPENSYITADGRRGALCMAPAMDIQIVKTLFNCCIKAVEILGIDSNFSKELQAAIKKLPPDKITSDGRIMEWQKEYTETEINHRHTSHLFGLFPGELINESTPELLEAAKKSIQVRLNGRTEYNSWSAAWLICLFARLGDGAGAYSQLELLLNIMSDSLLSCAINGNQHVFQIDGNMGATAGITELLMQSHGGVIRILPALPEKWQNGYIRGLKARGGFGVDIEWRGGKPWRVVINSSSDSVCNLKLPDGCHLTCSDAECSINGDTLSFAAKSGKSYVFM